MTRDLLTCNRIWRGQKSFVEGGDSSVIWVVCCEWRMSWWVVCMLLWMYWGRHYGALQHADGMVCDMLTYNRIWWGQKSFVEGDVWMSDMMGVLLGDVCRDKMFACYCKCIWGVNTAHCNTLMQCYMVHWRATECAGVVYGKKGSVFPNPRIQYAKKKTRVYMKDETLRSCAQCVFYDGHA